MLQEFREFIQRGNVIDLAVGFIMGAAFTAVVNSLVKDVITPLLGLLTNGINFSDLYINLSGQTYASYTQAKEAGAAVIGYGAFIDSIITFLLTALAVFFLIKAVNQVYRQKAPAPAPPTRSEELLVEIRDVLARQS